MLRNTETRYGLVAIILHWLIGLLFIGQIVLGLVMVRLDDQRLSFDLIQWHKSFGFLILVLVPLRIAWRLANLRPALPDSTPAWEHEAASATHLILYLLMLVLPLTGWVLVSVSTLGMPTFAFYRFIIPNLPLPASDGTEEMWAFVHQWLSYAAAALVGFHVLAALRHQFILRDGLLVRMLVPGKNAPAVDVVDQTDARN
ncbi:MAG: cytochrome b [Rhizobiaceae bacterium]